MREINRIDKLCRICLSQGSRNIFDQSTIANLMSDRNELKKIAEKLRFVTMLKVNPLENLPQQICDLCIVQLNVSYNFKRLALKNDFYMRNYLIENGISVLKDEMETTTTTTALEIHQIHNVIRTNHYPTRQAIPEIPHRRNSTTSSVSGSSTLMIINNGRENESNSNDNHFATPASVQRPMMVHRPIQIKTEPIDPDEAEKETNSHSSSPSTSVTTMNSVMTVSSLTNLSKEKSSTPMTSISSEIVKKNPSLLVQKPAPLSVKLGRAAKSSDVATNDKIHKSAEASKQKSVHSGKTSQKQSSRGKPGYSPNGVKLGRPKKFEPISTKSKEILKKAKTLNKAKENRKIKQGAKFVEASRISPRKKNEPKKSVRIQKKTKDTGKEGNSLRKDTGKRKSKVTQEERKSYCVMNSQYCCDQQRAAIVCQILKSKSLEVEQDEVVTTRTNLDFSSVDKSNSKNLSIDDVSSTSSTIWEEKHDSNSNLLVRRFDRPQWERTSSLIQPAHAVDELEQKRMTEQLDNKLNKKDRWEMKTTSDGKIFFTFKKDDSSLYVDPRTGCAMSPDENNTV